MNPGYRLFLLIAAIAISSLSAFAQAELSGSVTMRMEIGGGRFINMPSSFFFVKIENEGKVDSIFVNDVSGSFSFKELSPGSAILTISDFKEIRMNGKNPVTGEDSLFIVREPAEFEFKTFKESFELVQGKNLVLIERKRLNTDENLLDPAYAVADSPLITFRGDTLVYNTNMLTVGESSYAIDILRQLPGVEIQGKNIAIVGENVSRTYVNGALIFGFDPMDAFENLSSNQVTSIETYKEDNPLDGIDGRRREKQRVLDIKTKDPIFSVADIKMSAYAGIDNATGSNDKYQIRYLAGAEGKFFSQAKQLSAGISTNNLGVVSFRDMVKPPQYISNNSENLSAHFTYEEHWNNPLVPDGFKVAYNYGNVHNKSWQRALTERYETNGIPAQILETINENSSLSKEQNVNTVLSVGQAGKVGLRWDNDITFADNSGSSILSEDYQIEGFGSMMKNQSSENNRKSWMFSEQLAVDFRQSKLNPQLRINVNLGHDNGNAWDLDTTSSSYIRRYLTKESEVIPVAVGAALNGRIAHLLKADGSVKLELDGTYSISYNHKNSIQTAFDLYGSDNPVPNMTNTYDFTTKVLNNKAGVNFLWWLNNSGNVRGSVNLSMDNIADNGVVPASNVDKRYFSIVSSFSVSIPFNGRNSIIIGYSSNPILPSVEQLRDRIDDSNPLVLVAGNSDLMKSMAHNLSLTHRILSFPKRKNAMLQSNINAYLTVNPIARKILYFPTAAILEDYADYYIPAGATLNVSENTSPSFRVSGRLSYSDSYVMFKGRLRPKLSIDPTLGFSDSPQYFGDMLERTKELTPEVSINVEAALKSMKFSIQENARYVHSWNSRADLVKNLSNSMSAIVEANFLKQGTAGVDYSMSNYHYLNLDYNDLNVHRLGAYIGVNLLKGNLKLTFSGHDLLNGGSVYGISTGPSSVTQTWAPVFGRYFLLGVNWRINTSNGSMLINGL